MQTFSQMLRKVCLCNFYSHIMYYAYIMQLHKALLKGQSTQKYLWFCFIPWNKRIWFEECFKNIDLCNESPIRSKTTLDPTDPTYFFIYLYWCTVIHSIVTNVFAFCNSIGDNFMRFRIKALMLSWGV